MQSVHSKAWGILPGWIGQLRAAPDASKDWGQNYTQYDFEKTKLGTTFTWDITKSLSLRSGYSWAKWYNNRYLTTNNIVQTNGTYNQMIFTIAPYYTINQGGYGFIDGKVSTGPIQHKLTGGFYGNFSTEWDPSDIFASSMATGLSLNQPTFVPEPALIAGTTRQVKASETANRNWMIGDNVIFNDHWSALVGVNYVRCR